MRKRALAVVVVVAMLVAGGVVEALADVQKRAITHEDVWLMKRLGAPVVSPDGKWAVVSVSEPAYEEKDQTSDLWIVATDGSSPPRRLTATRGGESGAAWGPDGRRLAFSAKREGDDASQLYVLDVAQGGEAQRVTSLTNGARAPRWKPDGTALLFTSEVFSGATTEAQNKAAAAERKARKWNARTYDNFPIRHWDRWLDDKRPSLFVQALMPGAEARDLLAGTRFASRPGFGGQLTAGGEDIAAAWTSDGAGVIFVATTNRHEGAFAESVDALWLLPAEGGEPRRLTADRNSYGDPTFSPDGRRLFASMQPEGDRVFNNTRLASWSWPAMGAPDVVAGGADRSIGTFELGPDGRVVYFLSEDAGHERLYTVPAGGGPVREVGTLDAGVITGLSAGGPGPIPVLVALWQSAVSPPEVVRLDAATGARTALTSFNVERAARIDWQPVREFWFTSTRGARIHNLVVVPPAFDATKRYPLFVVMHGGPHGMWRDEFVIRWNFHLLGSPGYVVLLTNYTGSTGFGETFAQGIQGDPLAGPASEINEAADEAIRRFGFIDGTRQVAGGASYGGHLANWLAVTTTRYRALVSHAGLFDLKSQWTTSDVMFSRERNMGGPAWDPIAGWRDQSPFYRSVNLKTPILVTVGERDFRVPLNNALEFWSVLQRQRVPSRLVVFPEENHWILKGENSRFFYGEVHGWLARHLAGEAPSSGH